MLKFHLGGLVVGRVILVLDNGQILSIDSILRGNLMETLDDFAMFFFLAYILCYWFVSKTWAFKTNSMKYTIYNPNPIWNIY